MYCTDYNGSLLDLVASWQNEILLRSAARLVRRIVASLHLLDELAQHRKFINLVCSDVVNIIDPVVHELLQKSCLHSRISH